MKIHDKNNLLSIVIKKDDIVSGKNFETKNDQEFQIASLVLMVVQKLKTLSPKSKEKLFLFGSSCVD